MKKRVENYIPPALSAIRESIAGNNTVKEEYDGYAASLGPAIIASGLLPAISFYTDIHKDRDENKPRRFAILGIITCILNKKENKAIPTDKNGLLNYLIAAPDQERQAIKPLIMDAIVATKLALRNFKQVKSD
ncbi:MAG: type III-B CRISPR module-associated protein Cmr5 [Ferruginibacter sp.]